MNAKDTARSLELLKTMNDARQKQVHARADSIKFRCDTITGLRRYATYERQVDRYETASFELVQLLLATETAPA